MKLAHRPRIASTMIKLISGTLMKLAHRPRIASTMIKLISKPIVLPICFINFSKNNSANHRWPEAQIIAAIWFGRIRSQSRSPYPGFGQNAVAMCFAIIQSGWPIPEPRVRVKRFSQSEFSSTTAAVARTTFRLDRFRNHPHSTFSCVKREFPVYTRFLHGVNIKC